MAKLNDDQIEKKDIQEYLEQCSDFAFELKTLRLLNSLDFNCLHCGSYIDDNTKKIREFDIRATKTFGPKVLRLAVECKNLKSNFPMHVCCVPRMDTESSNYLIFSVNPEKFTFPSSIDSNTAMYDSNFKTLKLEGSQSIYPVNQPVGKSLEQVGRIAHGNKVISSDHEIYDRWAQALSSADDLYADSINEASKPEKEFAVSLVLPLLVVPDGMLWITLYDNSGNKLDEPIQVDRCSYYVDRSYDSGVLSENEFKISHLELVTLTGLKELIHELVGNEDNISLSFPVARHIREIMFLTSTNPDT